MTEQRLINANELPVSTIDAVDVAKYDAKYGTGIPVVLLSDIEHAQTIEERKKGKWIHERLKSENSTIGHFDAPECCCSECGGYVEHETGFCPHCGADMRQEGEQP